MKTETKILILALVLTLSAGPLAWVFSSPAVKQLPPVSPEKEHGVSSLVSSVSFVVPANITRAGDTLVVSGKSLFAMKDTAEELACGVAKEYNISQDNCEVLMALNPDGPGYVYTVQVSGVNDSIRKELGFRIVYRLRRAGVFGSAVVPPVFSAVVSLPDTIVLPDNTTLNNSKHMALSGVPVVYSSRTNETVLLNCTAAVIRNKILSLSACRDVRAVPDDRFMGLSPFDLMITPLKYSEENITVVAQNETRITASFDPSLNITEEQVKSALNWTNVYSVAIGNGSMSLLIAPLANVSRARSSLQALGASVDSVEWNTKFLLDKPKITLDGKEYLLLINFFQEWVNESLSPGTVLEKRLEFSTKYGEIIGVGLAS